MKGNKAAKPCYLQSLRYWLAGKPYRYRFEHTIKQLIIVFYSQ
jgi:hypothetical protein